MSDTLPTLLFATQTDWDAWLAEHHAEPSGVWLQIAKKGVEPTTVTHLEALESALCYGWIDGQRLGLDERHFLQKFTPRRPRSVWSQVNRAKVEALIAAGRMRPAGQRQVEAARADGRWDAAYPPQSESPIPPDLQAALDQRPEAAAFFATLNRGNRFAILYRIQTAKKSETRAARIAKFVEMLAERQTIYPQT